MHLLKIIAIASILLFISCDDGDIILTDLDFDTDDLEFCFSEESNETVFFNFNNDTNEVLFLIINEEFTGIEEFDNSDDNDTVGDDGSVTFLNFGSSVDTDEFFCNAVASVEVIDRELNGTEGTYIITTTNQINVSQEDDAGSNVDEDGDGLLNIEELLVDGVDISEYESDISADRFIDIEDIDDEDIRDTDGDGIPDFRDEDDDNDNVNTSLELYPKDVDDIDEDGSVTDNLIEEDENGNDILLDTDGDGAPDYLDEDDDGDGVDTRLEFDITENSTLPTNNVDDDGVAFYLNASINTVIGVIEEPIVLLGAHSTNYDTIVSISNATLSDSDSSNVTLGGTYFLGQFTEVSSTQFQVSLMGDGTFSTIEIDNESGAEIPIASGNIGLVTDIENDENVEETEEE